MNNEVFDQAERGTRAIQAKQTFGAEVLKCEGAWLVPQEGGQIMSKGGTKDVGDEYCGLMCCEKESRFSEAESKTSRWRQRGAQQRGGRGASVSRLSFITFLSFDLCRCFICSRVSA